MRARREEQKRRRKREMSKRSKAQNNPTIITTMHATLETKAFVIFHFAHE